MTEKMRGDLHIDDDITCHTNIPGPLPVGKLDSKRHGIVSFSPPPTSIAPPMASTLLGKAGKRLFEQHLQQYAPADPLYEEYTDENGKKHRRKREIPPGLSKRDQKILKAVKRRAHRLDKGFHLCGLRFGWTFLISLIPVVGDVIDASLNYFLVVRKAGQADLPPWLLNRMRANNAFSFGISFIPIVGDVILAVFKANSRNAALLEEFLRLRGEEYLKNNPEEAVQAGVPKKKWYNFGPKMSKEDTAQVKPGSGMTEGRQVASTSGAGQA